MSITPPFILPATIRLARRIAVLLDTAFTIPIIRKRIGLDPLLGLIPGGGDVVGLILSSYIIGVAIYHALPVSVIVRMVINMLIDTLIGAIPILGDLFDAAWKANMRNLKLLEEAYMKYVGRTITLTPGAYTVQAEASQLSVSPIR